MWLKMERKYRAPYIKTYIRFIVAVDVKSP